MTKNFWLVKQEPEAYSWETFVQEGGTDWTGIRNFQARNYLRQMKKRDLVFFYHSVTEKQVVGIAKVEQEHFPDPTAEEGDWSAVRLTPVKACKVPVTLEAMKTDPVLKGIPLIKQSRLSLMPIIAEQAERLCKLAETKV